MANPSLPIKDRFVAAVLSGDRDTVAKLMDPDFVLEQPRGLVYAGTYRGVDGFFDFLDRFAAAYDIESLENVNTFFGADPDLIVLEFRFRGLFKPTGERFDVSQFEPWYFRNGRVLKVRPHWFEMPGVGTG